MIHLANLVDHEKKVVWFSIYMHACGCFYTYGALICGSQALLESNNISTWLQGFQVRIENVMNFLLSLNPYIKLKLIELVIRLETKSFEMKCPPNGSMLIIFRATGQCIFLPIKFVYKVPVPKCLNNVLVCASCHSQFQ